MMRLAPFTRRRVPDTCSGAGRTVSWMTAIDEIAAAIDRVRDGYQDGVVRAVVDRETQLRQLRRLLVEQEAVLAQALRDDLGKSAIEAYSTEIGFTLNELDHALNHVRSWTQPQKVRLPMHLRPGSARVIQEPLGTVLIIAPWNYPVQLLLGPLIPALAAGNTAIVKPSEVAPATAAALADLIPRYLDERAVQVVTGGVEETTELLAHQFDHIFYTGNGTVGRVVMEAASRHLTPVTLELGGKSPAIVTDSADLVVSARRIAWGKFVNAGQTCVAPDYVLVPESLHDAFVAELATAVTTFFGHDPSKSDDYGRIVNGRHHARLSGLLDRGGYDTVAVGGERDADAAHGRQARRGGDGRGDLRPDPARPRVSTDRRRDRVRQRPAQAAGTLRVRLACGRHRPCHRAHIGRRCDGEPHAVARLGRRPPVRRNRRQWDGRVPRRGRVPRVLPRQADPAALDQA